MLDLIGYSTIPEDLPLAKARLLEPILAVPWWAFLTAAVASTFWLMWVSWPRQIVGHAPALGSANSLVSATPEPKPSEQKEPLNEPKLIPLREAALLTYEGARGTMTATVIEKRAKNPDEIIEDFARYLIAVQYKGIYGAVPPSRKLEKLHFLVLSGLTLDFSQEQINAVDYATKKIEVANLHVPDSAVKHMIDYYKSQG